MTFPVNSSLQCFRMAALSIVTLNMEAQDPMGRVYAENHSKMQKLLGVKGLIGKGKYTLLPKSCNHKINQKMAD